ncbi:MAG TPA: PTS sugar transporter subunit IIA [Roseomonas sp.]|nr:PTS sugar transporter subunit IIA [Roseomonas sp.]
MIGMVLVSHGQLAEEFRLAMEHVVGPQLQVETVCIGPEDDLDERKRDILGRIAAVDRGDGVVILTDMMGGTPSNLATAVAQGSAPERAVEVIAGLNLPLLVKLARIRSAETLGPAVEHALQAGRKYIACPTHIRCAPPAGAVEGKTA